MNHQSVPGRLIAPILAALLTAGLALSQQAAWQRPFAEGSDTIQKLLLQFDPEAAEDWLPACRDLLVALPADVQVEIAVADLEDAVELRRLLNGATGIRPTIHIVDTTPTCWTRDRLLVIGGDREPTFWLPRADTMEEPYVFDVVAATAIAELSNTPRRSSGLVLEGGDLLCSAGATFVSVETVRRNAHQFREEQFCEILRSVVGGRVVVLGGDEVPHEHLDMYVTLLGPKLALVGDPQCGHELLQHDRAAAGTVIPDFDVWTADAADRAAEHYETVARQLQAHGIGVRRLPIVHGADGRLLTWNNALVERRGFRRRVYLPSYGLEHLQLAATRVYTQLGCDVLPIRAAGLAENGGTVRCITNVVRWHRPTLAAPTR